MIPSEPESAARDCASGERRRFILRLAAAGAAGVGGVSGLVSRALAAGDLPTTPGINRLEGTATVNGRPAIVGTPVTGRDKVSTGPGSLAVVVVKGDAFLVRENTVLEFAETGGVLGRVLVHTGRVLSVFSRKPVVVKASIATIGIRGTGAYVEVNPDHVYFCLCYGEAELDGPGMAAPKRIKTTHHDAPLMISDRQGVMAADPAQVKNHTDDELVLLESLVGRTPPFLANPLRKKY